MNTTTTPERLASIFLPPGPDGYIREAGCTPYCTTCSDWHYPADPCTGMPAGTLARLAYELAIDPHAAPAARQAAAARAAVTYAAGLPPAAATALAAEQARQGIAGHTHPRHFDHAWTR